MSWILAQIERSHASSEFTEIIYDKIFLSLMNQYTPNGSLNAYPEIDRRVSENEYRSFVRYAENIGVTGGYIQDKTSADEAFIPEFNLSGVDKLR